MKNVTIIQPQTSKNEIIIDNNEMIELFHIDALGNKLGYIFSADKIHSALVEYIEKHSVRASSISLLTGEFSSSSKE